jgi:DNA invertase Pin-like site-specific DNA recombinase
MNTEPIQETHRQKLACIYLHQSTLKQVRQHQESTERQYALRDKALQLGWLPERILILDRDLGISGTQMANRPDFQGLVSLVSLQKVGAVFALEASRWSRSDLDWHRLVDLSGWTGTLLIDEDGAYHPVDFNNRLLLGLKGTMSQAELHFLRVRLQGGKLSKARKGQLRFPLPVGFVYAAPEGIVLDPDQEVQGAVRLVFTTFGQTASAYGVVQHFAEHQLLFPKRSYGGVWNGQLRWSRLNHGRVLCLLRNPAYAGAYVFGRHRTCKKFSPTGQMHNSVRPMPLADWQVNLPNQHPGYISWEEYLANQQRLARNQTNGCPWGHGLGGARRASAVARSAGLWSVRPAALPALRGRARFPRLVLECNWRRRELAGKSCWSVRGDLLDEAVAQRILSAMVPAQVDIALAALAEVEQRDQALDHQWQLKIQRAEYEGQLAQRRFEEVDPANRLVAATLEQRWEHALRELEGLRQQYRQYQEKQTPPLSPEQQTQVRLLANDLPRLWQAATTSANDRKRILRLLLKDITLEKRPAAHQAILHLRWQGGATEDLVVDLPLKTADRWRYPEALVNKVRQLAQQQTDHQIAVALNQEGLRSAKGRAFTDSMVAWIRGKHRIPAPMLQQPGELTVRQLSQKFAVSQNVVYYWLEKGLLTARSPQPHGRMWITLTDQQEQQLQAWVTNSKRIAKSKNWEVLNEIALGAV